MAKLIPIKTRVGDGCLHFVIRGNNRDDVAEFGKTWAEHQGWGYDPQVGSPYEVGVNVWAADCYMLENPGG